MKTAKDPRHKRRIYLMQKLFTWNTNPKSDTKDIQEIIDKLGSVDNVIKKGAPLWPIAQINKIDLAILRLAVYELTTSLKKSTPPKVIIDEAIELAKEFGSDTSSSFVNGVLGKIIELEKIKT